MSDHGIARFPGPAAYDIAQRAGLPEHLRVLARRHPRAQWRAHPNFSDLTAFWLDRHLSFREVMARMQSATELQLAEPQARFVPQIARYAGFFLDQLHEHHGIEDHHYFPRLSAFDRRLARGFEMLDADHHALDTHMSALAGAVNALIAAHHDGKPPEAGALRASLARFAPFLDRHLEDEEEIIVPVLLEYGHEID